MYMLTSAMYELTPEFMPCLISLSLLSSQRMKSDARQYRVGQPRKASWRKGALSQLLRRGGAQLGREEGGGENATPLEHLAPSKPCIALSKPAVGSLPSLVALVPSLLPSQFQNSLLSQLLSSCWGHQTPFCPRKGHQL